MYNLALKVLLTSTVELRWLGNLSISDDRARGHYRECRSFIQRLNTINNVVEGSLNFAGVSYGLEPGVHAFLEHCHHLLNSVELFLSVDSVVITLVVGFFLGSSRRDLRSGLRG